MQYQRVIFSAKDIDAIVTQTPQADILQNINICKVVLDDDLPTELRYFWKDKLKAYQLALDISIWLGDRLKINNEYLQLKANYYNLLNKYTKVIITKNNVHGGMPI